MCGCLVKYPKGVYSPVITEGIISRIIITIERTPFSILDKFKDFIFGPWCFISIMGS